MNRKENKKEKSTFGMIKELEVGKELLFPLERMTSIKSMATTIGTESGKVFKTTIKRNDKIISVKRLA